MKKLIFFTLLISNKVRQRDTKKDGKEKSTSSFDLKQFNLISYK